MGNAADGSFLLIANSTNVIVDSTDPIDMDTDIDDIRLAVEDLVDYNLEFNILSSANPVAVVELIFINGDLRDWTDGDTKEMDIPPGENDSVLIVRRSQQALLTLLESLKELDTELDPIGDTSSSS